jgi:hypothetical protein
MTPQERAKDLVNKYKNPFNRIGCIPPSETMFDSTAKQCALIAVDEILNVIPNEYLDVWQGETYMAINEDIAYWERIKQEIRKI